MKCVNCAFLGELNKNPICAMKLPPGVYRVKGPLYVYPNYGCDLGQPKSKTPIIKQIEERMNTSGWL